jgi:hypothetical protein
MQHMLLVEQDYLRQPKFALKSTPSESHKMSRYCMFVYIYVYVCNCICLYRVRASTICKFASKNHLFIATMCQGMYIYVCGYACLPYVRLQVCFEKPYLREPQHVTNPCVHKIT